MVADQLRYPALSFLANGALTVVASSDHLTRNTRRGLKRGYYAGLRLVDMSGRWFVIRSARKLHALSGYSLLLNQWIRVELDVEDTGREAGLDEVRRMVLKDFAAWDGWSSRGDFDVLVQRVEAARTIPDLLETMAAMVR